MADRLTQRSGTAEKLPASLRVGQLCAGIVLAYDWLHAGLTTQERQRIVAGLDRQGIQPFIKTVKQGNWRVALLDNFMPAIVGGVGIAGMSLAEDHLDSGFLVKTARQRMKIYLSVFGPDGEWNESVGYAGSVRDTVDFYLAWRSWTATRTGGNRTNPLSAPLFLPFLSAEDVYDIAARAGSKDGKLHHATESQSPLFFQLLPRPHATGFSSGSISSTAFFRNKRSIHATT